MTPSIEIESVHRHPTQSKTRPQHHNHQPPTSVARMEMMQSTAENQVTSPAHAQKPSPTSAAPPAASAVRVAIESWAQKWAAAGAGAGRCLRRRRRHRPRQHEPPPPPQHLLSSSWPQQPP